MITLNTLKERNNALVDELRRIEGAIRENNYFIALIQEQEKQLENMKVESIEKIE